MEINELCKEAHQTAKEHGFWEGEKNIGEVIALMHSELSEAFEAYRNGKYIDESHGLFVELADCVIRIFDFAGANNIDLDFLIRKKMEYNKTRPFKHNKKC